MQFKFFFKLSLHFIYIQSVLVSWYTPFMITSNGAENRTRLSSYRRPSVCSFLCVVDRQPCQFDAIYFALDRVRKV